MTTTPTRPASTLVEQLETLPDELARALAHECACRNAVAHTEAELDVAERHAELRIRREMAENARHVTDRAVDLEVGLDDDVIDLELERMDREHELREAIAAVDVIRSRERCLAALVQLRIAEDWNGDEVLH